MENLLNFAKKNIMIISASLILALYLSFVLIPQTLAQLQISEELSNNCANTIFPKDTEKNTVLDEEHGVVYVSWYENGHDVAIKLPYQPNNNFQGCSEEIKGLLNHVKGVHDKYISDLCIDFEDIIGGKKPLPEKNGLKANIEGAKNFVNKYCSLGL